MSDEPVRAELIKIEERTRRIEQKIYNGMSHTLEKLEDMLPHLLTIEEHGRLEQEKRIANMEMGKRRDRVMTAIGLGIPFITALVMWLLEKI